MRAADAHRARDRLGDVVQLEIEEHAPAPGAHQLDRALALGDEQLEPDLVERGSPVEPVEQRGQRGAIGDVERDDHALARRDLVGGLGHRRSSGDFGRDELAPPRRS